MKDPASPLALRLGSDPRLDAWYLYFLAENTLDPALAPLEVASSEQLRFMVVLAMDALFAPCSDKTLSAILQRETPKDLVDGYAEALAAVSTLIDQSGLPESEKETIRSLCEHKYRAAKALGVLIPSRLKKRLATVFLARSGIDDPSKDARRLANAKARRFVESDAGRDVFKLCSGALPACDNVAELRFNLDMYELCLLFGLSMCKDIWTDAKPAPDTSWCATAVRDAASPPEALDELRQRLRPGHKRLRVLYMAGSAGEVVFDLLAAKVLARLGHQVMLSFKEGFFFDNTPLWDVREDPSLADLIQRGVFIEDNRLSKNALLSVMGGAPAVFLSDGTRERFNFLRASVTFARAWKESDLVIAKGWGTARRLLGTSHAFTRDVFCLWRDLEGQPRFVFKPRAAGVRAFTETDIAAKADALIGRLKSEREAGKKIMFYSAIIGSIPHETPTAIRLVTAITKHLSAKLPGTYVINPAEHFEEGMDGDDLMFMWERVQRSGLLDIWRFQTDADIEKGFELLGEQIPPVWSGKDSTYSTGCTKEMTIALAMQQKTPELQIIGPAKEKFFRRREYGIGKYCDAGIACP